MAEENSFRQNEDFISFETEPPLPDRHSVKRPPEDELEEGECPSLVEDKDAATPARPKAAKAMKCEDGSRPKTQEKSRLARLNGLLAHMSTSPPWFRPHARLDINMRSPVARLSAEIQDFVSYISPTEQEKRARAASIHRIEAVITKHWPEAQVRPFGSYYTGLYLPTR